MKVLLDTHALLWWLSDSDRLGDNAREIIADPAHDILVSVVSLWEIAIKIRIGKLDADINDILAAIPGEGFSLLQIQPEHLKILMSLPMHHRDPFDHLLMAQAQAEHATFLSEDGQMDYYSIKIIRCS
ncbi:MULTISPECIES: type II toxin-antitoxin system VapC family toxin [Komagataeibacter]|uniref:PIN domain-containing protein n=2 Tax=Komagataeibacter TaxID=1434011 RepID=A0A318QGV9_9PROT|nr:MULTISPECIES: type II toxin-antitoxin system VapC family toxin [Komagataeibacter]MBV1825628.1 type II toxin-antitoxin system VapC family toxin [Komagataeibacter oboediens]PYD78856.1 PIN domain-containing protein [Komagataeibacter oboediens]QHC37522.1 type II toxin-antitoxin system VapC family toxin [Komagataeibacter xylinus]